MDNIINRFKKIREEAKLSQKDFGEKINISQSQIASYENGHRNLTERTINDICRVFNINKNWLLNNIGPMYEVTKEDEILSESIAKLSLSENKQIHQILTQLTKLDDKYIDLINKLLDGLIDENKKDK